MSGRILSIAEPRLSLSILGPDEVGRLHTATLDVIEKVGVRFPSPLALDLLEAHGASVDRQSMVARIPGPVIESALKLAPPAYSLAARDPEQDLPLDGAHVYLGTDGCGVEVIDLGSGKRRMSTKADAGDTARVADALDEVAFWWSMISAQDCPPETRGLHEL